MEKQKVTIVTHDGSFHADDVFAVMVLEEVLGKDFDVEIVRTRIPEEIKKGDYVVDVGGIYDPSTQRYDHHQEDGAGERENGIRYSSIGLVWKEYGEIICGSKEIAEIIDQKLVVPMDAHDNGFKIADKKFEDVSEYSVSVMISAFRPSWNESDRDYDKAFERATKLAKEILEREIVHARGFVEGRKRLREQIEEQGKDSPIIEVDHNLPWLKVIIDEYPNIKFVVYQRDERLWQVKGVRLTIDSFEMRALLPEEWSGKVDEELQKVSGVPDAVFCHINRFTGAALSREGAWRMAELALENEN